MGSSSSTAIIVASILSLVIAIILVGIAVVLIIIRNGAMPWWVWLMLSIGAIFAILFVILLIVGLMYRRQACLYRDVNGNCYGGEQVTTVQGGSYLVNNTPVQRSSIIGSVAPRTIVTASAASPIIQPLAVQVPYTEQNKYYPRPVPASVLAQPTTIVTRSN